MSSWPPRHALWSEEGRGRRREALRWGPVEAQSCLVLRPAVGWVFHTRSSLSTLLFIRTISRCNLTQASLGELALPGLEVRVFHDLGKMHLSRSRQQGHSCRKSLQQIL